MREGGDTRVVAVEERQAVFEEADYYVCYQCGRGDDEHVLLICDRCDWYCCHIYCDPRLGSRIPDGDWYCRYCQPLLDPTPSPPLDLTLSSIDSSDPPTLDNSDYKPVAARTRSRLAEPSARILHRLRRRR